ncbi:MAG: PAS domain-containing protein [Sandaracinus sp.]|nr:PAS domain-containing protein [Sandaracinus sp.]
MDFAPDALLVVDEAGLVVFANRAAKALFGTSELVGEPVETWIPKRFREAHVRHRTRFASAARSRPMGVGAWLPVLRADGVERLAEISLAPLSSESGGAFVVALRDMSERVHGGHLNEGLQIFDEQLRYLYINAVAAEQGRRPREELLGRTFAECYPGVEQTPLYATLQEVLREGGSRVLENEFRYPDGRVGWFELRMGRVPEGVMIVSFDITARKHLELQVRRMHRMDAVGKLAGGLAHDFNNLLTVVKAHASFLQEDLPADDPLRADVEAIVTATDRASDLTHRLLGFARPLPTTNLGSVSVVKALGELARMLRRTLGEAVLLELSFPPDVGHVGIAATNFDQVVVSLILNARDALRAGKGRIVVEAEVTQVTEGWLEPRAVALTPGEYVVVSVSDNGVGIPADVLERLFEPFYTTKGEGRGTGLGLSTAWGLVAQTGGTIRVYSEVGIGTTFRVYLPRTEGAAESPSLPHAASTRGRGELILVAEDQVSVREVFVRTLKGAGYEVVAVASATEAMERLAVLGERVALLVSDVVMPRTSGLELAEKARALRPELEVLLVSGFTPRSLEGEGLDPRDLPVLVKPFSPDTLLRTVRGLLDDV